MDNAGSVTRWLMEMREGSPDAFTDVWERYFQRLADVVRGQLFTARRTAADESDVALSTFQSFFRGVREGKFSSLRGRDELWRVLLVIAKRKAISLLRREYAQRRGAGQVVGSEFVQEITSSEPTPELAATVLDEFHHLLALLRAEDPTLALIAARKCEGLSNHEIAAQLAVSVRTVERKVLRIGIVWSEDLERRFGQAE